MNNFYRVIAISFRHRFTVAASLLCSLAVAVLWGGNITAIYPIVDVVMNNKSVPQFLDEQQALAEQRLAELPPQIDDSQERCSRSRPTRGRRCSGNSPRLRKSSTASGRRWLDTSDGIRWLADFANERLHDAGVGLHGAAHRDVVKSAFRIAGMYYTGRIGAIW